jgi:hypothetical protein
VGGANGAVARLIEFSIFEVHMIRAWYRRFWATLVLLFAMSFGARIADAQIWRHFIPGNDASDEAPANKKFAKTTNNRQPAAADTASAISGNLSLTQENGPWLIMAASFSGEGAQTQADNLAQELRKRFGLRAYLHQMSFGFGDESPGRGLDEYGAPVRRRYQRGGQVREYAVLIGDFAAIDDPQAQQILNRIKTLEPDALNVDVGETAQSMAQVRRWEDALLEKLGKPRKRGPMAQAFFTRNPLLPREYFVPKGVDSFVAKMNDGVEHSLLDCPGAYTVKVATFRGKTILQTSAEQEQPGTTFWNRRKKDDRNPLVEAAENAHLLTEELRNHGFEAYEFHDRTESIVTIGSFAQAAQRMPDGRVVVMPAVQRIIETFGAAYDTPSDPLTGIGNDSFTQQRVAQETQQFNMRLNGERSPIVPGMNPKHVKILRGNGKRKRTERIIPMDVHPHVIDVPKRSIASAYAG